MTFALMTTVISLMILSTFHYVATATESISDDEKHVWICCVILLILIVLLPLYFASSPFAIG